MQGMLLAAPPPSSGLQVLSRASEIALKENVREVL